MQVELKPVDKRLSVCLDARFENNKGGLKLRKCFISEEERSVGREVGEEGYKSKGGRDNELRVGRWR